jgi:phosphoglycolate phosphatase
LRLERQRAFIFDFDGTLAPNLDLQGMRRGVIARTLAAGVPEAVFEGEYIIEIIDAGRRWLLQAGRDDADAYYDGAHAYITRFELEAARAVDPFPEVRGLLGELRSRGSKSAVVTRNCESAVYRTFPDIDAHLDVVLARDNVRHPKPDPRHLEAALARLQARASEAVMIGDGALDMTLGRSLGLCCIGVLTGSNDRAALEAAGADLVLERVGDLAALLGS